MINEYRAEVKATLALYREAKNFNALIKKTSLVDNDILKLEMNLVEPYNGEAGLIHKISKKYWTKLLYLPQLARLLSTDAQKAYLSKIDDMAGFEFNERNISALTEDLIKSFNGVIDAAIMKCWDTLTHKFSMENPKNIHYYNGWKHNKAFKCNQKVIIPLKFYDQLHDIDIAFSYLDTNGRLTPADRLCIEFVIENVIRKAQETKNIHTDYFKLDIFKKGTCHITIKSDELLKKFNLYCGKRFNWLPDDYGQKPYNALTPEEKALVEDFEGEESYNDTYNNRNFYLSFNAPQLPALNAPDADNNGYCL